MKYVIGLLIAACSAALAAQDHSAGMDSHFPQQMTAKDLLFACASSSLTSTGRERQKYCHGFVSGVEEGIRLQAQNAQEAEPKAFCVPPGKKARELASVYMKYASGRNVDLSRPAASIVVEALEVTFPCPRS